MKSKIIEIHNKLVNKEISCTQLTKEYLERAKKINNGLNCFITITEEKALESARKVDEKISRGEEIKILEGIPCSIKDLICTKDIVSTGASKMLKDFKPPYSATCYKKLEEQGVILIGKNNCDEFAMGGSNENSGYGVCRNPVDPERVPGGTSGGSACSVASDTCVFSIGTDTGGSIRQPAAFCGCVGMKVSYGRVSRFGVMAMASSWDTVGPLANSVEDIAIVLENIAGVDPNDSTTLQNEVPKYTEILENDISKIKIGLPKEYFQNLDGEIADEINKFVEILKKQGYEIKEISLPMTKYAVAAYYISTPAEVSANMARYDGLRYGPTIENPKDLDDIYLSNRTNGFGNEVKRRIIIGNYVLSHGYFDAYYKKSQKVRTKIIEDFDNAFKDVDIILSPVAPTLPYKIGEKQDPLSMYMGDVFTIPASAAGIPGLSLPIRKANSERLPINIQLLAPMLREDLLLNVGYQFEKLIND